MGNDENVLRKIRIGQLHGASVTVGTLSQSTPDTTLYGLPYLFSSLDDAAEIRKTTDPMLSKEIEKNGFVNLVVYNALGQEVEVLVNQHQSIGKYTVQFNANNLPSGSLLFTVISSRWGPGYANCAVQNCNIIPP